jgi:hypothetical protein
MQWNDVAEIITHLLHSLLGNNDIIAFLQSSWSSLGAKTDVPYTYARWQIHTLLSHIRETFRPLLQQRLHLPGFCIIGFPICIERLRPENHDDIEKKLASTLPGFKEQNMDLWIQKNGMQALKPPEVIFAINAWPRSRRAVGARLSQFFVNANARFFLEPPDEDINGSPQMPSLAITFQYHDLSGIVWAGTIAQRIRDNHQQLSRHTPPRPCQISAVTKN